ncbi:SPOR domain-containing protein [Pusillimonas sp. DMV24BSW_D]|uniref:SPOR domain-containing protein n=1 Tax=Neopusillimonas aestuarii TaxID=2716226 RepID=UPI00140AF5ED|nr:SPOR domain-containing protein [Pusillimonas sp. DMV24BSW_D]QIM49679.1 SPOR domain-containing protein [Pusillimonas sp. DMV24BSW_D]
MGLFSRDSGSASDRRKSGRSTTDSQANELRVRARRRLVGALVLVVAAVIVVPMLIDTNPPANDALQPIVLPPVASSPEGQLAQSGNSTGSITIERVDIPAPSDSANNGANPEASSGSQQLQQTSEPATGSTSSSASQPPAANNDESETRKPESTSESAQSSTSTNAQAQQEPARNSRSDDGAVALALLEGRQPPGAGEGQTAQSDTGSFVLQIAAYTTEQDANARRDKLFEAGVTNAFVERAVSGGKPTYRLRVGPFPSREAAQAAQTRLRALGYDNGFISSK